MNLANKKKLAILIFFRVFARRTFNGSRAWPFVSFTGYNAGRLGCVSDRSASEVQWAVSPVHTVVLAAYTGNRNDYKRFRLRRGRISALRGSELGKNSEATAPRCTRDRQTVVRNHVGGGGTKWHSVGSAPADNR